MADEKIAPALRPGFRLRDERLAGQAGRVEVAGRPRRRRRSLIARASDQEWAASALLLLLDVVSWFVIYGFTSLVRGESYYSSAFVFLVIDLLQMTVIVMALFTVGGYDRTTETRSLAYATEHLLAIIAAAVVSIALIYSAATFDQTMKPSRSVVLVSFIIFLPISLEYRRWLRAASLRRSRSGLFS